MTDTPAQSARPARAALNRVRRLPAWWLLPAGALVGSVAGGAYGLLQAPEYTATSYVVAVPTQKSDPSAALGYAQAYGRVATQLAVLGDAQVWSDVSLDTLRKSVRAEASPDAPMISISATATSAKQARDMSNAVSQALVTQAGHAQDDTQVRLVRLSRAAKPGEPSSASASLTLLVGASAGGLLAGLALLARPRREPEYDETRRAPVPAPALATEGQR